MPPSLPERIIFIEAIGVQESGGNYGVVNGSSGALGKYQVLPSNLNPWQRECGLRVTSADTYLHSPIDQDSLARCKLGGDYDTYGPAGAAAVWYSGQPNPHATYGNPPVYQYVDSVLAIMRRLGAGQITLPAPGEPTIAPAREANWSHSVDVTRTGIEWHRRKIRASNEAIGYLLTHKHHEL